MTLFGHAHADLSHEPEVRRRPPRARYTTPRHQWYRNCNRNTAKRTQAPSLMRPRPWRHMRPTQHQRLSASRPPRRRATSAATLPTSPKFILTLLPLLPRPPARLGRVLRSRVPLQVRYEAGCIQQAQGRRGASAPLSLAGEESAEHSARSSSIRNAGIKLLPLLVDVPHRLEDLRSSSVRVMSSALHTTEVRWARELIGRQRGVHRPWDRASAAPARSRKTPLVRSETVQREAWAARRAVGVY